MSANAQEQPSPQFFAVTPHDTNPLAANSRGIYVGATGDLRVRSISGDVVTFVAVPAGLLLPIRCDRVLASGTTASSIVALA